MTESELLPQPAHKTPEPWSASWILFGPRGLRAGWGILFFLVISIALSHLVRLLPLQRLLGPSPTGFHLVSPLHLYLSDGIGLFITAAATLLLSLIERRPIRTYGIGSLPSRAGQFIEGLFWGLALLSLLVGVLWQLHLLTFNVRILSGPNILRYALIWIFGFLLVALAEEYTLRGYLQFTLARGIAGIVESVTSAFAVPLRSSTTATVGFWAAAVILSWVFGAGHGHNPGESPLGLVAAGLAGLVFCLALWRTGSLWWAIGFHCTWDWAESFLFGVGDSGTFVQGRLFDTSPLGKPILSGGATGPEGSIYVLPTLALIALIIFFTLPRQPGFVEQIAPLHPNPTPPPQLSSNDLP